MSDCKTILYIGGMLFPEGNAATQRVIANAHILKGLGYSVKLLGFSNDSSCQDQTYKKTTSTKDIECYVKKYPKVITEWIRNTVSCQAIIAFIQQMDSVPDSIIAYNFPGIALQRLSAYCRKNNISIYADCTEWYNTSLNPIKTFDTFWRMRYVQHKLDGVICISNHLENYYKKFGVKTANVPSLVLRDEGFESSYSPNHCRKFTYVGFPGKSRDKDRLDTLVKAFFQLESRRFQINIIGVNQEEFIKIYPALNVPQEFIDTQVVFHGRKPRAYIKELIGTSDFSIFVRAKSRLTDAGFPTKLAESYSFGTPVVTTESSNVKEYIIDGKSGFIIKTCNLNDIVAVLNKSLQISDGELKSMHSYCMTDNPLYYKQFTKDFESFMEHTV